jgi:hypothetical protein
MHCLPLVGVDKAEMDLALVAQSGLRDARVVTIVEIDIDATRGELQRGADTLEACTKNGNPRHAAIIFC